MCSTMLLVVQSTIVLGRSVRGSAAKATTTSLARTRSWAGADAARPSSTASAVSSVVNRLMTASSLVRCSDAELRVQHVAQPVAHQVDAERGDRERGPREGREPPGHVEVVAALREHAAPGWRRRLHAEAEEGDGGLGDDELGELETAYDDDGRRHVGQDVPQEQPRPPEPQGPGRVHELAFLHRQDLPTDDASIHDPARD